MRNSEPGPPLRIGVVLDAMQAPAWAAWAVKAIRAQEGMELSLAVISDRAEKRRRSILFALYEALDRRVFRDASDALEPVDVSPALEGVPIARLAALPEQRGKYDHSRPEMASDGSALDVLVCLGTPPAPGDVPLVVRHGIWYLHLGDRRRNDDEPALFWEVFFAEPASEAALEAFDESPEERRVLYRSATSTDPISLRRTRNAAYWKSARFVLRRLEDLAAGRWAPDLELAVPRGREGRVPSNADAVQAYGQARRAAYEAQAPKRRLSPPMVPRSSAATSGHPSRTRIPVHGRWYRRPSTANGRIPSSSSGTARRSSSSSSSATEIRRASSLWLGWSGTPRSATPSRFCAPLTISHTRTSSAMARIPS